MDKKKYPQKPGNSPSPLNQAPPEFAPASGKSQSVSVSVFVPALLQFQEKSQSRKSEGSAFRKGTLFWFGVFLRPGNTLEPRKAMGLFPLVHACFEPKTQAESDLKSGYTRCFSKKLLSAFWAVL